MNNRVLTLVLIILALASASLAAYRPIFLKVHGADSSLVCLADPGFTVTSTNACPATAPTFLGPNATSSGAQLRININVNNTSSLNGFDITILADHTRLQPFGVDLSSSMLSSASISTECVGGIPVQGTCPSQAAGNPNSIQLGVGGSLFTANPSFGVLFTVVYTIVGNTTGTGFSFQTGCGNATSLPPLCVMLTSGGFIAVPAGAVQTASYDTSSATPFTQFINLKPKPPVLNFTQGTSGQANSNVTMIELNGFSCGGVNCLILSTIKPSVTGLTISTNVTQLSDPPMNGVRVFVSTLTFTPPGIYPIEIQVAPATGPSAPSSGPTYLGAFTTIIVSVVGTSDFAIASSGSSITATSGTVGKSTIEVAGGRAFTGTVTLTVFTSPSTGLVCNINPQSLSISTSPSLADASLSCVAGTSGVFSVTVSGSSGSISHNAVLSFVSPAPPPGSPSIVGVLPGNVSSSGPSLNPGQTVTFAVNLTNAPPIHAYTIQLEYNPKVLAVAQNGIDPTGGLLGNSIQTLVECVDGTPLIGNTCTTVDGAGVITLSESIIGSGNSTASSGVLFTAKFNVLTRGLSQIHIVNAVVVEGAASGFGALLDVKSADGYFANKLCGSSLCRPPLASFTISPPPPIIGSTPTQFDASATKSPNQGASISGYTWFWNDFSASSPQFEFTTSPVIQHTFVLENRPHFITLAANDSYGAIGYATVRAQVVSNANFSLVGCPPLSIPSGSQASCDITVINHGSATIDVVFGLSGFPASITPGLLTLAAFSSGTATLAVSNPSGTPEGTRGVIVTGTSGGTQQTVTVVVNLISAPPPDFLLSAFPINLTIPSGSSGVSQLYAAGLRGFTGTVTITGNVSPAVTNAPIASFAPPTLIINPSQPFPLQSSVTVSTVSATPPGNYVLTVIGTSGPLSHLVQVFIQVTPPPRITVSPATGPVGTKVIVIGSEFQPSQISPFPVEVVVTFDDMLLGFIFTNNGRFNFTFDVPQAQPGVHQIKASANFFGPGLASLTAQASFQVEAPPGTPTLSMDSGSVYFPGDTAVIYILTTLDGNLVGPANGQLDLTLTLPNGTKTVLHPAQISTGVYKSSYLIPTSGSLGVYALVARLHVSGSIDAFALRSFEVKLSWLSSNGKAIGTTVTIAGTLGLLGLGWKKGLFKRKDGEISQL